MKYKPENDGIDHINVYSKGKTELGRFLSNFAYSLFVHPEDGTFESIEGYWYWLGCNHPDKDLLRKQYGYTAKRLGRELGSDDWIDTDEFKRKIKQAIFIKIYTNSEFLEKFKDCGLPFTHYYVYNGKVVNVPKAQWIIEYLEYLKLAFMGIFSRMDEQVNYVWESI